MTRTDAGGAAGAEPERLGAEFRAAREALGYTLDDVARTLRIRRAYLVALEEGRLADLPAPAYAIGFIRSYARVLGLDDDALVRHYRELSGAAATPRSELIFPEPVPDRAVPTGALVLVGSLLAFGAYIGWYQWSGNDSRTVDTVPPPPRLAEPAAPPTLPPDPVVGSPPPAANAMPVLPIQPVRPSPTPPPAPAAGPAGAATPAAEAPAPPAEGRVVLRAKSDVWVQVREGAGGASVMQRILKPGESYEVPARAGLVLHAGNMAGLEVLIDGAPAPGVPPGTGPRRNIALDPERLRAAPEPQPEAPKPRPKPRPRPRSDSSDAAYVPPEERGN
ncbi:helix-turn-helix domain-containing protein [Roseicella aquatilis]|nr:helix-turn-helix domain-containing protein [Roseicella aquatilis]